MGKGQSRCRTENIQIRMFDIYVHKLNVNESRVGDLLTGERCANKTRELYTTDITHAKI